MSSSVGGATGDYAGNHGDSSPGSIGAVTDFFLPGNGTGVINTCRGICDSNGNLQIGDWLDKISLRDIFDGTSNTVLAGELHVTNENINYEPMNGAILKGRALDSHSRVAGPNVPLLTGSDQPGDIYGFGSAHPGVTNFVFTDGSVQSINNSIDPALLGDLCHRNDGQVTKKP